jgi:perosamine synthetase|tara:strand:- start:4547 stop:5659 length:1113 start_codon:yes stop_codon:yes gene_type:complete
MKIPLCKSPLTKNDLFEINKSLKTGWLTHGKNNIEFENNFKKITGAKYAISMNSCTSALECSLKGNKIKGEVIIPSWTWVSTANAVLNSSCIPVFADVNLNSRNITADEIKKVISKKTKAIIIVHYGGLPCDMDEIVKLCKKRKIYLIEDSAETLGGTYKKKFTGTFGIGCFSFFPTKNITTTEGGMLTTADKNLYEYTKKLIAHGIDKKKNKLPWKRESVLAGHNFRMPNHLAALGTSQLKKLSTFNAKRNLIAKKYDNFFNKYPKIFKVQKFDKKFTHSYQMYNLQIKSGLRTNFIKFMRYKDIEISVHFDPPLHKQRFFKKFKKGNLANTEILSKTIITMPIYPTLKYKEIEHIFKQIKKWMTNLVR